MKNMNSLLIFTFKDIFNNLKKTQFLQKLFHQTLSPKFMTLYIYIIIFSFYGYEFANVPQFQKLIPNMDNGYAYAKSAYPIGL